MKHDYNILEQVPDVAKVAVATSAPALTVFGVSVEQWTFVLSAVVSLLFIVEKLPIFIRSLKQIVQIITQGIYNVAAKRKAKRSQSKPK